MVWIPFGSPEERDCYYEMGTPCVWVKEVVLRTGTKNHFGSTKPSKFRYLNVYIYIS